MGFSSETGGGEKLYSRRAGKLNVHIFAVGEIDLKSNMEKAVTRRVETVSRQSGAP